MPEPLTFYWHDYETFGADPALDRPAQFAGVRTDEALQEIGEPLDILCRIPPDYLPHPEACLIHRITPQRADAEGLPEPAFAARLHAELARPGTCGAGYNSLRFDDEVTRHLLYRTFHDPYEREYRHGNSRWDLIDVLRLARLLRPEGLEWPDRDGKPGFRLEELARANGIAHANAHDALADVRATIALARRLRDAQPRLFAWALGARSKDAVFARIGLAEAKPLLHVSSRFPAEQGCAALVLPLAAHPVNRNSVIVCNLLMDPSPLLELDAAALRERLYTRASALGPEEKRVPLKEVHANRCPMIGPAALLTPALAERHGIDLAACEANRLRLAGVPGLARKVREVFAPDPAARPARDPEAALYGGGFPPERDRLLFPALRAADEAELGAGRFVFEDARLAELLFRHRARHFPGSLTSAEREDWKAHCEARLHGGAAPSGLLGCEGFFAAIARLREERAGDAQAIALLEALSEWGEARCGR